jgi:hypothetical protein
MLPSKFRFIWLLSFRGEDFLEIDQSETRKFYCLPTVNTPTAKILDKATFVNDDLNSLYRKCFESLMICAFYVWKWAVFIEDLSRMLPTKFRFIWPSGFRGEDFLEIDQSETRIACGSHVCTQIGTKWAIFIEDLPMMLSTNFRFIWPSGFREDFLEIGQSETRIAYGGHICWWIGTKWALFREGIWINI